MSAGRAEGMPAAALRPPAGWRGFRPVPPRSRGRSGAREGGPWLAALLLLPATLVTVGLIALPLAHAFWISLHRFNLTDLQRPFVGWANYAAVLGEPGFILALTRTAYFTVVSTLAELVLGLLIALLLHQDFRGRGLLRALVLLPWALPTIVNGMMWRWIDHPEYGALNALLHQLGLIDAYRNWLGTPWSAMHMIILADVWKMTPLVALVLLANLQTIPDELYEAAAIDGAGALAAFRHVTLPWLRTGVLVVMVLRTIEAFKVFDIIYIMTRGGPANGTQTIAYYAYTEAFSSLQFGRGAAISFLIAVAIALMAAAYFRLLRTEGGPA